MYRDRGVNMSGVSPAMLSVYTFWGCLATGGGRSGTGKGPGKPGLMRTPVFATVVMGSPLYWHNICGLLRNFLDRCYGPIEQNEFKGKDLYFIVQGAAPEKW